MADARAKPSELELQVLSVLWQRGPSTARQVLEALPDGKALGLHDRPDRDAGHGKKGLLTHTRDAGRGGSTAHLYKPIVTNGQVLRPLLRGLVDRVFGGSTSAAVQQLLDETDVTADEVAQIRAMLREKQRQRGGSADD